MERKTLLRGTQRRKSYSFRQGCTNLGCCLTYPSIAFVAVILAISSLRKRT